MKLPTHNRYDYVPITKRADYTWPGGKRLAVYFCNNIEYFAFGAGLGSDSATGTAPQSQRNYAWRDYSNRVGVWRMFDLFDPYTHAVTGPDEVDMSKVIGALGLHAERVSEPAEVLPALRRALAANTSGRPAYIEFICSQYPVYGRWVGRSAE